MKLHRLSCWLLVIRLVLNVHMQQWSSLVISRDSGQLQAQANRGLNSHSPHRINWKGIKCQACSHHSKTVKTLPPPNPSHSHPPPHPQQPPTAVTKLFPSLPRFASPDKNLQRSPDSVHKHAASLVSQRLCAATLKKMGLLFLTGLL